ncbi:cold-shock protein [uncultured Eudoraea sp.]|nr:cold shock domain-containing protein [uncultured Eudoraea sp.]
MTEGTVKFFNRTKGFGFIKPENDNVKFNLEKGQKGMNAVNVEVV